MRIGLFNPSLKDNECRISVNLEYLFGYPEDLRREMIFEAGYGPVSRGAIYAFHGLGFKKICVYTQRPPYFVDDQNPDARHGRYFRAQDGGLIVRNPEGIESPPIDELAGADIICNDILQGAEKLGMFVQENEVQHLKHGSAIIDISCDEDRGFSFAPPTTFADPVFQGGDKISYHAVDHTPSPHWRVVSSEISTALLPYLGLVEAEAKAWERELTIAQAIDIRDGVVQNPNIVQLQKWEREYVHGFI